MTTEQTKEAIRGEWISIAPEIRPSVLKNEDGSAKPFYLTRNFKYAENDKFELTIINSADPYGKIPLVKIFIRGHIAWLGDHPIKPGAQKADFTANEAYEVTPLAAGFADVLNMVASKGYDKWEVGHVQSIFGKTFAPFGLVEGQNFKELDLIYVFNDMLFWGARNVDGRSFDKEENRPANLQIPLARK
jgi:rRNA processing protein Gar1